jgi:RNase P/RNase MRP subunit p30
VKTTEAKHPMDLSLLKTLRQAVGLNYQLENRQDRLDLNQRMRADRSEKPEKLLNDWNLDLLGPNIRAKNEKNDLTLIFPVQYNEEPVDLFHGEKTAPRLQVRANLVSRMNELHAENKKRRELDVELKKPSLETKALRQAVAALRSRWLTSIIERRNLFSNQYSAKAADTHWPPRASLPALPPAKPSSLS